MAITKQKKHIRITYQGKEVEQVDAFRYLGAVISESGKCSPEIQKRLGIAREVVKSLNII